MRNTNTREKDIRDKVKEIGEDKLMLLAFKAFMDVASTSEREHMKEQIFSALLLETHALKKNAESTFNSMIEWETKYETLLAKTKKKK